ncbi:LCCL domain-containing protein [Zavarzinella formosa]|uniref:LCCL domain-containing protein n=1 Tax=Zavarzinella formosa TaxID=360055 RepID=UPI0002D49FC8|nr:LCCL domain-containing protein [Zavarzinella formosa]
MLLRTHVSARLLAPIFVLSLSAVARPQESVRVSKLPEPVVDVKLNDDSMVKLKLCEESVDFQTKFGKLAIPLAEIRKIEFGHRVSDEMGKQIDQAVANLGSPHFRTREEAGMTLLNLRDKAYPALVRATQATDAEVVKRAEEIVEKIKAIVPENKLNLPEFDVIVTDDSRITGKILCQQIKAKSFTFGDVSLKLADTSAITILCALDEKELASAQPDPGSMTGLQREIGKTYLFKVTGSGGGPLWGTDTYTLDSSLAVAAVHMGVLKVGQTGYVRVTILGPMANFTGSTRNGLTSSNYQNYPGAFKIHAKVN